MADEKSTTGVKNIQVKTGGGLSSSPDQDKKTKTTKSYPNHNGGIRRVISRLARHWRMILVLVVIIIVGLLAKGYTDARKQLKKLANPQAAAKNETEEITNLLSRTVELPKGEAPTLATVNDSEKLKSQEFFKDSKNGDKVLVYSKAGKAILYRPSTKKVIQLAPINLDNTTP